MVKSMKVYAEAVEPAVELEQKLALGAGGSTARLDNLQVNDATVVTMTAMEASMKTGAPPSAEPATLELETAEGPAVMCAIALEVV